jgi:death on curing protein
MAYLFFNSDHAIRVHDKILEVSGGLPGIINRGNLESILVHIENDDYYPTFEDKLTHLVFAVNKGHCFQDANKRTSIALGAFLLEVNGLDIIASKFIIEMENIAVAVADDIIDKDLLREIISSIIKEEDYNEDLKLKIISVLQNNIDGHP